jgi:endoglucanase
VLPRRLTLLVVGLLLTSPLTAVAADAAPAEKVAVAKKAKDPRKQLGLFVDPKMPAAQEGPSYAAIAQQPQALWFGSEYYPTASVKDTARDYLGRANAAGKTPMMVVYSIPNRDCGEHSAGGLPGASAYKAWIKQLAKGIKGSKPLLVLEPDALGWYADSSACAGTGQWLGLLKFATKKLSKAGAWVYLDAGHSGWTPYDGRALLLKKAGIKFARGFSTNVSNFRSLAAEQTYAGFLLAELRKLGITGKKYVVDTSRNGAATPVDGDVINPTWARLGAAPQLQFKGAFDGTLWVKHPGESDGTVNSSAYSGQWCDQLADRLIGQAESAGC